MTGIVIQLNILGMPAPGRRPSTPKDYRLAFIKRTRQARERAKLSQEQIATELSHLAGRLIVADTYRKWEKEDKKGALLPHDLIIPFCRATGMDVWELLTGSPFDLGAYAAQQRRKSVG